MYVVVVKSRFSHPQNLWSQFFPSPKKNSVPINASYKKLIDISLTLYSVIPRSEFIFVTFGIFPSMMMKKKNHNIIFCSFADCCNFFCLFVLDWQKQFVSIHDLVMSYTELEQGYQVIQLSFLIKSFSLPKTYFERKPLQISNKYFKKFNIQLSQLSKQFANFRETATKSQKLFKTSFFITFDIS